MHDVFLIRSSFGFSESINSVSYALHICEMLQRIYLQAISKMTHRKKTFLASFFYPRHTFDTLSC